LETDEWMNKNDFKNIKYIDIESKRD